jgi:FkbM family methyltransferase
MVTKEDVIWGYRICLDREPESESVVQEWMRVAENRRYLAQAMINSDEYRSKFGASSQSPFWHYHGSFNPLPVIEKFAKKNIKPSPVHVTNFLGVKIRPEFFPKILSGEAGKVQPLPIPANWHSDIAEWGSCLRSIDLSGDRFVMLELGCGWGCWMNNLGVAAKSVGKRIKLFGIEADTEHLRFARLALTDNEMSGEEFTLAQGIAGKSSSVALFPKLESGINWGGSAIFNPSSEQLKEVDRSDRYVRIPVVDISNFISDEEIIDFVHVDIQGAELDLLTEIFELLCQKVRYIFIGTHSKQIEAGLFNLFTNSTPWKLEMERAAIFTLVDGTPFVSVDGVQAWRNPAVL